VQYQCWKSDPKMVAYLLSRNMTQIELYKVSGLLIDSIDSLDKVSGLLIDSIDSLDKVSGLQGQ
jgi:hypothetical protein